MNTQQFGVLVLAVVTVSSLSLTAATFPRSDAGSTRGVSSGVFGEEDVTLKDPPGPSSMNVSKSPWLQAYYEYFESGNQSDDATNASGPPSRGTNIPPFLFAVVAVLVSAAAGGLVWFLWLRSTRDDAIDQWNSTGSASKSHSGRDGDSRPWTTGIENDVHRAWYAMARHLEVPEATSDTPRELALVAIDRGLDREAVRDLTSQFERVRYGRGRPTSEREQRARAALERLGIDMGEDR